MQRDSGKQVPVRAAVVAWGKGGEAACESSGGAAEASLKWMGCVLRRGRSEMGRKKHLGERPGRDLLEWKPL